MAAADSSADAGGRWADRASALDGLESRGSGLAERQKTCPVTGMALGSMGTPERQVVSGRVVFLCCGGCRSKLLADPGKYLAKLPPPTANGWPP